MRTGQLCHSQLWRRLRTFILILVSNLSFTKQWIYVSSGHTLREKAPGPSSNTINGSEKWLWISYEVCVINTPSGLHHKVSVSWKGMVVFPNTLRNSDIDSNPQAQKPTYTFTRTHTHTHIYNRTIKRFQDVEICEQYKKNVRMSRAAFWLAIVWSIPGLIS